jgi:hypothetical protein
MKRPFTYSVLVLLTSGLVLAAPLVVHPGPIRAESDRTFTIHEMTRMAFIALQFAHVRSQSTFAQPGRAG